MTDHTEAFRSRLLALSPESATHPVADLYDLVGSVQQDVLPADTLAAIYQYFERHPNADHGAPGPLVHLLERHSGGYEGLLSESVKRKPTYMTLWMVNRILNSDVDEAGRAYWAGLLQGVATNSAIDERLRSLADEYLQFQRERDAD
jgi:hypothetical protein